MNRRTKIRYQFVEFIPRELEDGVVYISIPHRTAIHACCCGCGEQAVTPLSPKQWRLIYDGQTVSLDPSIGNWSFACQSHYWIRRNEVMWAPQWSREQIRAGRGHTASLFEAPTTTEPRNEGDATVVRKHWWQRLRRVRKQQ